MLTMFQELTASTEISDSLFDSYLDIAQAYFEQARPWVYTRAEDSSQQASAFSLTTAFNLPTGFLRWYDPRRSVLLVASLNNGNYDHLRVYEIPQAAKFEFQYTNNRFFCDYANSQLYFTGSIAKTYTIYQFFIKDMPMVSANDGNGNYTTTWWPPARFHKFLPLAAASFWQMGADYDVLSNPKGNKHAQMAATIFNAAAQWDDDLAHNAQFGLDSENDSGYMGNHRLEPDWWKR